MVGDFNCLTKGDYDPPKWKDITEVRKKAVPEPFEPPKVEVTDLLKKNGYIDCWVEAGRQGLRDTSRFKTRVDYTWCNDRFWNDWSVSHCYHIDALEVSDHNMVVTTFEKRSY